MAKKSMFDGDYPARWTPEEMKSLERKISSTEVPDNGKVHYGSGMPGSLCGTFDPNRQEVSTFIGVTCPTCRKLVRARP